MEETQNQNQETQQAPAENPTTAPNESVTFSPLPQAQPSSKFPKVIILVVILIILGIGGYLIFKRGGQSNEEEISPTTEPLIEGGESSPIATTTPAPVDKTKIKIEVQNGTGIGGEAAYLSDQLKLLGYTNVKAGNAEDQTYTATVVTFVKTIPTSVQDEITGKLKAIYQEVQVKTSSTLANDVLIISGLRKGSTPRPSATPAASPAESPTASPAE
jgi:cytoskeletal protein RodZ